MIKKIFLLLLIVLLLSTGSLAGEKKKPKDQNEDYLTKGEAAVLITATDFMRRKIGALLSWTIGYDISRVNRARLVPVIDYVLAVPKAVPPDGRTIVEIKAAVDDPSGLKNISGVRADLTGIGKLSNMMLVDNGLWGDEKANDGVYTLQTSVSPKIKVGGKEIAVAVANKKGWLTLAKTSLQVEKDPKIVKIKVVPEKAVKGQNTLILLTLKIVNPGRTEDLKGVWVDLTPIGGPKQARLYSDGTHGDKTAGDDVFSLQIEVKKSVGIGTKKLLITATNAIGGVARGEINIDVVKE